MEWVETTGRTIEEAKDAALDQLGVDEQDAEFEVIEEPRLGLFGRLRSEARVRARVRPTSPRPKDERRDRRQRQHRSGQRAAQETANQPPAAGNVAVGEGAKGAGGDGSAGERQEHRPGRRRRGGGTGATGNAGRSRANSTDTTDTQEEGTGMSMPLAEQGERAQEFLEGLIEEFGVGAEFEVVELDEDTVEVRMEGEGLGLLIGPKGQTLAALQELTRCAVQQKGGRGRLLVDVSGYRQKRKEALERFTHQIAEEVRSAGVRRELEPMSAADRKIVHDTVNDLTGVITTSEGEEPRRRVVILPEPASS
jgi:spoIIIJ-associated protein